MTIGDVLATVAGVGATGATLWATLVVGAVLFHKKARAAATRIETQPKRAIGQGFLLLLTAGVFGLVLINQPNGLLKLVGWVLLAFLFAVAALGASGLSLLASDYLRRHDENLSPLAALGKASGLLIAAGFLPVLGWFLFFPIQFATALGAGVAALREGRVRRNAAIFPLESLETTNS